MNVWITDMPTVLLAFTVVVVSVAVGVLCEWLTRAFVLPRLGSISHQTEVSSAIHHGILIVYGLVVALIVLAVWETHSEAEKLVSEEATAIMSLYRDFGAYPEPVRAELQDRLLAYTEYVIHDAWPLQRRGEIPTGGIEPMNAILSKLVSLEPSTEGQKILHAETLRAYNELLRARRMRLDAIHMGIPGPMWAVVILGAWITLFASCCFQVGSVRLQRILIGLLASLIGLLVFVVLIYDQPFRGSNGVAPEAYELVRDHMTKR